MIQVRHLILAFILMVGGVAPSASGLVAQDANNGTAVEDIPGAIAFIEKLSDDTIAVWRNETFTADDRKAAIRELFLDAVDVALLSRGMLGRHFPRRAPAEVQRSYMDVMAEYILDAFNERMVQNGFEAIEVTGTSPAPGKRGHVYVKTQIIRGEGQPIVADWRLRKSNDRFQIVNLEIEGINLLITTREYFAERIRALGTVDDLIEELKAENAAS